MFDIGQTRSRSLELLRPLDGHIIRVKEGLCHSGLFTCLAKCYESTQEMSLGENSILNGKQRGRTTAVIFDTEFISPL